MSVYHEAPTETTTSTPADDITHLVCGCQIDAIPRLALCLADCSDVPERLTAPDVLCIVCENLGRVAAYIGCEFCRDAKWAGL